MEFTDRDLEQLRQLGIPLDEVRRQIEILRNPPPFVRVDRPCRTGDGIRVIPESDRGALLAAWEEAAAEGRLTKFVPASGAASRMFRSLSAIAGEDPVPDRAALASRSREGDGNARDTLTFLENLDRFAFRSELEKVLDQELRNASPAAVLSALLSEKGLAYGRRPKGLIPFHEYPEGPRTPAAEQLAEATGCVRDRQGGCRVHFTVSEEHLDLFRRHVDETAAHRIEFSTQDPSTDTIAVTPKNEPFRCEDGAILFRPGGHGALIRNLEALSGDIVLIKNIDNVVPDRHRAPTLEWKRILTGLATTLQWRIHDYQARLENGELVNEAFEFLRTELSLVTPPEIEASEPARIRVFLEDRLNRPLRVCGVVINEGEPGGGPFWVRDASGIPTCQIVESSQIDLDEPAQKKAFDRATHFNPVDLVCAMRDWRGRPYDLERFIDPQTVSVAEKSHGGRPLKALERPGLWNGAMAHWNTVFVEVPAETFTPVKTVLDLLRPVHSGQQ